MRYEFLLLLRDFKLRTLNARNGSRKPIEMHHAAFSKILRYSTLIAAFQFAIFGHTYPKNSHGTHNIKPVDPFKEWSEDEWQSVLDKYYPDQLAI